MKSFARTISLIFNPLFITVFAPFVLVYRTTHDLQSALHWTMYTVGFLLFLALLVVFGVKKKIFTDMDVSKREQRPLMFFISLLCGVVYLVGLFLLHAPYILYIFAIGVILCISIVTIINRRVKASIHVAAITALIVPLAISYQFYLLLLLIPLVAWSRLKTKRHSLPEVMVGGTVGSLLSLSIYFGVKFFLHK